MRVAGALPVDARSALIGAYRVGFTGAFTDILLIGGVIACVGSVLAFALVRSSDFVGAPAGAGPPKAEPAEALAG